MNGKIRARIVNGALVPLEPLGIEEGANVVFRLIAKAPPGVEPSIRDYVGNTDTKLPSEIDEELFIEEYLEKERKIDERNRSEFRVVPFHNEFLPGMEDPKRMKQLLDDEDVEHFLRVQEFGRGTRSFLTLTCWCTPTMVRPVSITTLEDGGRRS